ncbi:uncharacterized protein Z519_06122 [Cladophialophora bantiana CBS 173.52]|uniref:Anaphase-promoting complex subunit 4 WD40 domain-containing protein n=1 Tax=Cladophialophora bantiana (strain ATCC 10958 / CBS 173.52 / CDC B-1940 / NIH 8579) TaxID=1442370 RepID=A0A0D2G4I6_CLAB1|nr:uncharacterized protein Z519_06122 [Cladophialophora bantiana CBS 173.52]KIW93517.1 hypothetical protein Z519_06122 [Cladophialophora bantiana CBS 173.52]
MLGSHSTAPLHTATFLDHATRDDKAVAHERRLALALDIDQAARILLQNPTVEEKDVNAKPEHSPFVWKNSVWARDAESWHIAFKSGGLLESDKAIPTVPFRVLDAPNLKDDYYCSILAYSRTCHSLAVALGQKVYLWTEQYGVRSPPLPPSRPTNFVTSLAFSSEKGGKAILAVAKNSGTVTLWSLLEIRPRFDAPHPCAASCVSFKPVETQRRSVTGNDMVMCEDLLVGDDSGMIYYYSLEWPEFAPGSMTLLAKLDAHTQNICGLAWSLDGMQFVSGGNDNRALLFDPSDFLHADYQRHVSQNVLDQALAIFNDLGLPTPPVSPERYRSTSHREFSNFNTGSANNMQNFGMDTPPLTPPGRGRAGGRSPSTTSFQTPGYPNASILRNALVDPSIPGQANAHVHPFYHTAAVKAIAFAPWQPNLLATGGGSNDRQIHFWHTGSGAALALINVFSQVTSLV